jgi:hypothetical protein
VKLIHLSKHKESILVCSVGRHKVLEVSIHGLYCRGQKNGIEGPDIKEVEDKAAKDVKLLFDIGEASYMVPLDPGGSSSLSKTASPNITNGQEKVMSLGTPHFC